MASAACTASAGAATCNVYSASAATSRWPSFSEPAPALPLEKLPSSVVFVLNFFVSSYTILVQVPSP